MGTRSPRRGVGNDGSHPSATSATTPTSQGDSPRRPPLRPPRPPRGGRRHTPCAGGHPQHSASCWAAVSGSVYDLTAWIGEHPGGRDRIIGLCGTDATAAFAAQHRGQGEPAEELTRFKIGTLAG
ncbi:MAG: cytochrome b5 domain-containing protein [Actinomycetales bacterium]|uniref:Cytochrome b5 domain-containing protein n=1 Tax=Candidatus Phosphoribacter hodrii TaxID=2953743 RepID=A0A9D7TAE8_9MICO|nr:cytochrome b5 domain-containing protein [Candidatus Phosphoribacter hodrii]